MVDILMAAAFVGVVAMDDESDAAVSYTISVDKADADLSDYLEGYDITEVSNKSLKNDLAVVDGKITGTLVKAPEGLVKTLWGGTPSEEYIAVFTIGGLVKDTKIIWISSASTDEQNPTFKGATADSNGEITISMKVKESVSPSFEFIITASSSIDVGADGVVSNLTKDQFDGYNLEKVEFDVSFIGNEVSIQYTVGDLIYTQKSNEGKTYMLVSLDSLRAEAPEGKTFAGWYDATTKNTYPVGTVFVLGDENMAFAAVFEALPEAVITFVDGTSTLMSINVSDLSEKTVPSVEKTGYTFDGWFMGDVKVNPLTYTFEESVTLVAQWTPINCYVTFVAGDFVKTVPVLYGDCVQAPALPDGFEKWNFDFATVITGDITITAVEKAPEIYVTFSDGITSHGPFKVDMIEYIVPTVTKDGYTFTGWFIGDVKVDPLTYVFTEDTTLVAGWDPIKCKVVFMIGGVIYKEQTVEYGKTATEAILPEGYSAWDFDFTAPITKDITIYAIEKAPEKPTGLADPTVKMALVIVGLFICVLLAVIILKREDIRAGMVRKLSKAEDVKEDKKE